MTECASCRFSHKLERGHYECRRYAPRGMAAGDPSNDAMLNFATVFSYDWCGEFERRAEGDES